MCSFHTHIARAGFVVGAAMKRHARRQWTKDASHVMCVPLYARLVRPVEVLQLCLPDRHPGVPAEKVKVVNRVCRETAARLVKVPPPLILGFLTGD